MRHTVTIVAAILALTACLGAATPAKKNATPVKPVARPAARSVTRPAVQPAARPVARPATRVAPKALSRSRYYSRYRAPARPAIQQVPTSERYKEIQQSLAAKGYFKGEVDGQWNADSTDALKHFQSDQNLQADGKLDSLSLIGLGLGPKRMTAQAAPSAPPSDQQ